ncbi:AIPR family protein [Kocuria atrinae]|uniref:AIPR family protein n=1 Tax=Kocuria atrinae TaxID=592377 RepID=UPI001CB9D685|nr:AIPR family protein [Kocuria atrinae]
MSGNEVILVDQYVSKMQEARDEPLADDVAFEIFAASMALRGEDVTDDIIESGLVGGGVDGGIDAVYVFLDGIPLDEDSEVLQEGFRESEIRRGAKLTLHFVQAKRSPSFTETAFDKVLASTGKLLDLSVDLDNLLQQYAPDVVARFGIFRQAWLKLNLRFPSISVKFSYVTRGETREVHANVLQKCDDLKLQFQRIIPSLDTSEVSLLGVKELWARIAALPQYDLQLRFEDYVSKGDSYAGIVSLPDYYGFIVGERHNLRGHLFESNVRDFQGDVAVNRQISQTLESNDSGDFWWFNNGITILCSDVNIGGDKKFSLSNVQIVNGLQTSHSIYRSLANDGLELERNRNRSVQVRVIKTQDPEVRDRVIRATNSQTKVPDASLHATEEIHRQIESHFISNGWYYDRRKNFYKNSGKPSEKIVSISALGQAVMAIGLSRPNDARARPTTLLNNDSNYKQVFNVALPLPTFLWIAKWQRKVDSLLLSEAVGADSYTRTNARFYVSMYLATKRLGEKIQSPGQLSNIVTQDLDITEEDVKLGLSVVLEEAETLMVENDWLLDRVSKSGELNLPVIRRALSSDQT